MRQIKQSAKEKQIHISLPQKMKMYNGTIAALLSSIILFNACDSDIIVPTRPPTPKIKPTFTEQWRNDFNTEDPRWTKGEWTFSECNAMFVDDNINLVDGICNLTISERTSADREEADIDNDTRPYNSADYVYDRDHPDVDGEMYGRFASRMKVTAPPGVIASFFLAYYEWDNGYDGDPSEAAEIDIEFCGTTDEVEFALHYVDDKGVLQHPPVKKASLHGKNISDDYHLWEIEWLPTSIKFFLDGELLVTYTDKTVLNQMSYPLTPEINYWPTDQSIWDVGTLDPVSLPITTSYDYISYSSWDQANQQ